MDQVPSDDRPQASHPGTSRRAVVDLGSNSVRLVVYEGDARNPVQIFNEKAVLRLAKGMTKTGRLDEAAMQQTETVLRRYAAIVRAMGAVPFEVLATSAVRDAENGAEFVRLMAERLPDMRINDSLRRAGGGAFGRRRAVRHSGGGWRAGGSRRRLAGAGAAGCRADWRGGDPAGGRDPAGGPRRRRI